MRREINKPLFRVLVGIIFLMALSTAQAQAWNYRQHTKINWRDYSSAVFTEAKQYDKPVYVFIYSDQCSWCRKFETETLEKQAIREMLETNFIPVLVNQVTQPDLAKQLGITLVPANILLTHDNKKLLRFYGFLSTQALSDALSQALLSWEKGELPDEEFGDESTCCPISGKH